MAFECFSYKNLGYNDYKELGPGEITVITDQNCITLKKPGDKMKICTFLWVYYGYPASSYEVQVLSKCVTTAVQKWLKEIP